MNSLEPKIKKVYFDIHFVSSYFWTLDATLL